MIDLMLVSRWVTMMNFHLLVLSKGNFVDMMILQALCIVKLFAHLNYVLHYIKYYLQFGDIGVNKIIRTRCAIEHANTASITEEYTSKIFKG